MWEGRVTHLFIAPEAKAPMTSVDAVRAVPGRGLQGDRYFYGRGAFSRWPGPRREVTLIAEEALVELEQETGIVLPPEASRRNILVRGVPLNDLVKQTFQVGEVAMQGLGLCQPCKYLVRLTGEPGLLPGLIGRGGLRARLLNEGEIRVGDCVFLED